MDGEGEKGGGGGGQRERGGCENPCCYFVKIFPLLKFNRKVSKLYMCKVIL
jgi:hypothetical protein